MNILITGGSSGLGRAVVRLMAADQEHRVYFTYNRGRENALSLTGAFPNVHALEADFSRPEHIEKLLESMDAMDPEVLVNNAYAGSPQGVHFHKTDPEDFLSSFKNNLIPTIRISGKALLIFRKKKFGKIINVLSSALLNTPPAGYSVYAANKAYLWELSKAWNKEYAQYNITSNCIAPGYMTTDFAQADERMVEQMRLNHPLKKLLSPEEAAELVKFLILSPQQLNGVTIPINAGQALL
jgi:NAD(P)-dependent dehydrogenase (short-subunit alcohol dehydrogenase family)